MRDKHVLWFDVAMTHLVVVQEPNPRDQLADRLDLRRKVEATLEKK